MSDSRPNWENALALYRRGEADAARSEALAALAIAPSDSRLLHFLGVVSCRAGLLDEGAGHLARAVEIDPADSVARFDLAMALHALGRAEEALRLCGEAPNRDPPLRRLEGQLLQAQGRFAEAAAAYESVLAQQPDDWEIWNNLGNSRRSSGDVSGAIAALERAVSIRPDVAPMQANLGAALARAGESEAAVRHYRHALALEPKHGAVILDLARLLRHLGRFEEALELLRTAPGEAEAELERGRALAAMHRLDEAQQAYRSALRGRSRFSEAYLELGILLERAGRIAEVPPLLAAAQADGVAPDVLAYLHALVLQRQGRIGDALAWLERAPPELEPVRTQRLTARLADKGGDAALAFAAATRANRLAAEQHPGAAVRAAAYREHVAALAQMATNGARAAASPLAVTGRPAPAFLVGFPRSGTTLLDTLLMGHPGTHVLEEVPLLERVMKEVGDPARVPTLAEAEVERLRALYFSALDEAAPPPPGALVVDKLPLNILGAPLIHRLFPDAAFILALRHPCDVVLSCFMQGFEINDAMANFLDLEDTARLYDGVLSFWQRWSDELPLRVLELRYESLVGDVEAEMRLLVEFLGLPWSDSVLDHRRTAAERGVIPTPSYNQVTERVYSDSSGRWRRYREQLAPVLPILLPWAKRLGYDD
ncbi:MAG TPA: sulfotransferase [Allosphingosinicella sp.]|nr:sulfotransferase [Allosphingosinicella sp.]